MGDVFPTIKAAVVQAASVLYDREKTLDKAVALIEEAARKGSELVAFSESFLPGYPYHIWLGAPVWYRDLFKEWFLNSVEIPSKTTDILCDAARTNNIDVVMGVSERDGNTCYNTLIFINRQGKLLGKHRKIMPTHAERVHWGLGDGSNIKTWDFDKYRLSGLLCWEHSMDLMRYAMIAQRPQIHVASWVGGGSSAIIAPGGKYLAEPLKDDEGILYAELDLNAIADWAHLHDAVGHYSRPDLFSLLTNTEEYRVTQPMIERSSSYGKGTSSNGNSINSLEKLAADIERLSTDFTTLKSSFQEKLTVSNQ